MKKYQEWINLAQDLHSRGYTPSTLRTAVDRYNELKDCGKRVGLHDHERLKEIISQSLRSPGQVHETKAPSTVGHRTLDIFEKLLMTFLNGQPYEPTWKGQDHE